MKKYSDMVQKKAYEVINLHEASGLMRNKAIDAAIVTLNYALNTGLYPGYEPINRKALNFLNQLKNE